MVRLVQPAGDQAGLVPQPADFVPKIRAFIDAHNALATPFVWVATAQSIIDKVARLPMPISGTAHCEQAPLAEGDMRRRAGPKRREFGNGQGDNPCHRT